MDYGLPGTSVHGLLQARILEWQESHSSIPSQWGNPHALLQGIFLTQGPNLGLWHCRQILYCMNHQANPQYSVVSDSLWPQWLRHPRLPWPSSISEPAQTHVHRVSDAIQPSCPLSSLSPPAFNFSQHQRLFQWVSSSHLGAKVLESQLQNKSFWRIFRTDFDFL